MHLSSFITQVLFIAKNSLLSNFHEFSHRFSRDNFVVTICSSRLLLSLVNNCKERSIRRSHKVLMRFCCIWVFMMIVCYCIWDVIHVCEIMSIKCYIDLIVSCSTNFVFKTIVSFFRNRVLSSFIYFKVQNFVN